MGIWLSHHHLLKGRFILLELSGFLSEKSLVILWIYLWARSLFCLVDLSCSFLLNDSVGISASLAASHPFLRGWSFLINGNSGQPRCGFLTVAYISTKCRISLMDDWQEFCRWTVFCSWMTSDCSDMGNLVSYIPFHCNLGHRVMLKRNTYEGLSEHRLQSSPETSKLGRTVDWPKHVYYQGWNRSPAQVGCMRQALGPGALGGPGGSGWRGRWEVGAGWGRHVNSRTFHINVWQNSLQIKKKKKNVAN